MREWRTPPLVVVVAVCHLCAEAQAVLKGRVGPAVPATVADLAAPVTSVGRGRPTPSVVSGGAPWGDGAAPWGWGAPPRADWGGPLPPPGGVWNQGPINYWGYNEQPVWDQGQNGWGFYFFGVWIPL